MATRKNIVEKVLEEHFDNSPSKMAQAIGRGLVRQNVERWKAAGRVPFKYCAAVKKLTGMDVYQLNDTVEWQEIKESLK